MEDTHFHVGILGTGLTESILAAALSKAGYKVVHIDENSYYGADEASLSLDELAQWIDNHSSDSTTSRFRRASRSSSIPPSSRQYAVCLCPTILPSLGPLITSLIHSGVSKYSAFRLLDKLAVYDSLGTFKKVLGSKSDIFQTKEIGLVDKRRLMRFLEFAASDFETSKELEGKQETPFVQFLTETYSLRNEISSAIAYALAFCLTSNDPTLPALKRLNLYLRSIGRYGPSPFLVGHYGGIGDIAQGFCRAAAVNGAVYILGRKILALTQSAQELDPVVPSSSSRYTVELKDVPDILTCDLLITSSSHIPSNSILQTSHAPLSPLLDVDSAVAIARCILIFEHTFSSVVNDLPASEPLDDHAVPGKDKARLGSAVLIFPPKTVPGGSSCYAATTLITGEDTLSAPPNKSIVYLSLPVNSSTSTELPEAILSPYIDVICQSTLGHSGEISPPIFKAFYVEHAYPNVSEPKGEHSHHFVTAGLPLFPLPDVADIGSANAEDIFYRVLDALHAVDKTKSNQSTVHQFWPPLPREQDNDEED